MKPDRDGFAAAVLPAERHARLRGRPSGLKGRYRDRCPTGVVPPKSWRVSYAASGLVLASLIS